MKHLFVLLAALVVMSSPAEARHRHSARVTTYQAHPGCGVWFPCEGVVTSARGLRVQRAMGGLGSPAKIYTPPHASRRTYTRYASRHHRTREVSNYGAPSPLRDAGRGVVKAASGAVAYVAGSTTHAFQCVIDKLEAEGYHIKFMGGYANHGHIRHSLHYSGHALDINQLGRGVTSPRMPSNEIAIANGCGLISGAQWADNDSGHFQMGGYAGGGTRYASRRHHVRYASRRQRHFAHRHVNHRYASAVR